MIEPWGVVLGAALVDSINPCAIGVLILLISSLLVFAENRKKMLALGIIYVSAVFIVYFLAGLGLITFLHIISSAIIKYLLLLTAVLIIIAGLIEIKDAFFYGKGFSLSIPANHAEKLPKMIKNTTIPGIILLGIFVAAIELPCTGGPYLAITLLLSQAFNFEAFIMLFVYNLIFVLPLLIILLLVYFGVKVAHIKRWKQKNKKYMRIAIGIVLIALGILLGMIGLGMLHL